MTPWTRSLQALRALWPPPMTIDTHERVRVAIGVALGLLAAGALTRWLGGDARAWLVAPLGASAVLVFGVPASPLAQPWPVVGGNTLSALVGIACVQLLPLPLLAAPLAAGLAVALMLALRCLHPPGGAAALLTVLAGVADWRFALAPVLLNSVLLVAAGMVYNSATGRRYPHVPAPPAADVVDVGERFTDADLDAALQRYNQLVDLPRDDLRDLLEQAEAQAQRRRLGRRRCRDIMTGDPAAVGADTPLHEAWTLLHERRVKALPVIDGQRRLVGIVTQADFMRAAGVQAPGGVDALLRRLRPAPDAARPDAVGRIMTRRVRVASAERSLAELLPLLTSSGHHHIPVIDEQLRLIGMVTQSDVIAELLREG